MTDFLTALALVLVIEGVLYAGFPDAMKRGMQAAFELPPTTLRAVGLGVALFGVLGVWLIRS
jgi:uncharacterized protein